MPCVSARSTDVFGGAICRSETAAMWVLKLLRMTSRSADSPGSAVPNVVRGTITGAGTGS